jgi:TRAP-type mannitol/chloroaromatic compound transport system permease small subunit
MGDALLRFADRVDALTTRVGTTSSWLQPLLVAVLILNVASRYGLGRGFIELEELQWHLYAAGFLLALAWTGALDQHVRVDLLRNRFSARTRAWIELLGSLVLLLPFTLFIGTAAFDFAWQSWLLGERSAMPSGLPGRWVIKAVLFVGLFLLGLQALGTAARSAAALRPRPRAAGGSGEAAG